MSVRSFLNALGDMEVSEPVAEAEEAYRGGVADLGDAEAAVFIQAMPGYFDYRSIIEELAQAHLGDQFVVWRAMTQDAKEEWESGADVGPVSVTFNESLAKVWGNVAVNRNKTFLVAQIQATPAMIVMRGKLEEQEIVLDGNQVSYGDLQFVEALADRIVSRLIG